jgi:hypothetical protein
MAYLRGQAVDGVTIGKRAIDHRATCRNRGADTVCQLDARATTMASRFSSPSGSSVIVTVLMGRHSIRDTERPETGLSFQG